MALRIREYDAERDAPALRRCCVALQDFERALDPRVPPGESIADRYLELMFERCRSFDGAVLVAESAGAVVGFVTLLARHCSPEPDDDPTPTGFVSDLVVLDSHRRRGLGRALLREAEARVRRAGVGALRLSVKAGNAAALALYASEGFAHYELFLERRLR